LAIPISEDIVRNDILEVGVPKYSGEVSVGMKVIKSGRTTGFTDGIVRATDAFVSVSYGGGKVAGFKNQIITTKMVEGGDSGSLLLKEDKETAVGLVFAGSDTTGVMNKISDVQSELKGFEWIG